VENKISIYLSMLARYNPNHVLHRLLPQPKTVQYNLRKRTHNFTLLTYANAVIKQNFVLLFFVLLLCYSVTSINRL